MDINLLWLSTIKICKSISMLRQELDGAQPWGRRHKRKAADQQEKKTEVDK